MQKNYELEQNSLKFAKELDDYIDKKNILYFYENSSLCFMRDEILFKDKIIKYSLNVEGNNYSWSKFLKESYGIKSEIDTMTNRLENIIELGESIKDDWNNRTLIQDIKSRKKDHKTLMLIDEKF